MRSRMKKVTPKQRAFAAVAALALLITGAAVKAIVGGPSIRTLAVLHNQDLRWHDGYNHYIVTVKGPIVPPSAGAANAPLPTALKLGPSALRLADATSMTATTVASVMPDASQAQTEDANQAFADLQAVPPNSAHPIVLHAGEPVSLLVSRLVQFPAGTSIERDTEGNIRAVPPAPGAPAPTAVESKPVMPGTQTPVKPAVNPPGWQSNAASVVEALEQISGVHTAAPVWGDRYQLVTTLTSAQVSKIGGVSAVAPNNLLGFDSAPATNDPSIADEYYLNNTGQTINGQAGTSGDSSNFSVAWDRSRGNGVIVADIDTGADTTHPDLTKAISSASENFMTSPPSSNVNPVGTASGYYHGTTVDGVMAGVSGNGIDGVGASPGVQILALKCSDNDTLSDSCIYAAGEYAISQGAKIINMSFDEPGSSDPTLANLVSDAYAHGVLITASAGNAGSNNDTTPVMPAGLESTYSNIITVGATDNQDGLAAFSNYGATTVDLMAPGVDDFTDYPGNQVAWASGTSYSAPLVASAAALLWSLSPSLSYSQVKTDILSSVHTVAGLSGKCTTGGRLDAAAALATVPEPVQLTFTGFDQISPASPANVSINATAQGGALPTGTPLGFNLELVYNYQGTMYAVVNENIDWTDGAGSPQAVTTGTDGTALIAPAGLDSTNFTTNPLDLTIPSPGLPSGTYTLMASAVQTASPSTPIGHRQGVFFNAGSASPTPASTTTLPSSPGPTTTGGSGTTVVISPTTTTVAGATTTTAAGATTTTAAGATTTTAPAATTTTAPTATTTTAPAATTTTAPAATTTTAPAATTTTAPAATTTTAAAATTTTTAAGTTTTTAAATTTTTTAAATTTTTAAGATTTTAAGGTTTTTAAGGTTTTTVAGGSFALTSIDPPTIPTNGGEILIFGSNIPANPAVIIGGIGEDVVSSDANAIQVLVGPMPAGQYDVKVTNASNTQSATMTKGLTVQDQSGATTTTTIGNVSGGPSGGTTTTVAGGTTTTTVAGGTTTTTVAGGTTTTVAGGTTTTTVAGGTTTTTVAGTTTTTVPSTPGSTFTAPNGLTLSPVANSDSITELSVGSWPAMTCTQILADNGAPAGSAVNGVDV